MVNYFEIKKNDGGLLLDIKSVLQRVADASGTSLRTVQRINSEVKQVLESNESHCNEDVIDMEDEKSV